MKAVNANALGNAIVYQSRMGKTPPGTKQAALRREIMTVKNRITENGIIDTRIRLTAHTVQDMPPDPADVALLVDTICMLKGFTTRDDAWRSIGVPAASGKAYLGKRHEHVSWPIWFTLRHAALGE